MGCNSPKNTSSCFLDHPISAEKKQQFFDTPKTRLSKPPPSNPFFGGRRKLGRVLWNDFPWSDIFQAAQKNAKSSKMNLDIERDLDANHILFTVSLFWLQPGKSWPRGETCKCNTDLHRRWRCRALSKVQCVQANIHFSQMRISALPGIRKKIYMPTSWWSFKPSVWTIMPSPIDHVQKVQRNPRAWSGKSYPCRIDPMLVTSQNSGPRKWKLPKSSDRTRFSAKHLMNFWQFVLCLLFADKKRQTSKLHTNKNKQNGCGSCCWYEAGGIWNLAVGHGCCHGRYLTAGAAKWKDEADWNRSRQNVGICPFHT